MILKYGLRVDESTVKDVIVDGIISVSEVTSEKEPTQPVVFEQENRFKPSMAFDFYNDENIIYAYLMNDNFKTLTCYKSSV